MPDRSLQPIKAKDAAPFPLDPVLIAAGANVWRRSLWRRVFGWKRHVGSVEAICRAVVEDCWNGKYFAGSAGHFGQFWTRDLAMCTPALMRLGHRERIVKSWTWGLERFAKAGRITTTIFGNRPRDVYAYACDSLPMLLYGLAEADADLLVSRHRELLATEIERYVRLVYDPETGLARTDGYFSAPRDCMTGRSTVFTNTMIALLARLLEERFTFLPNPLKGIDIASKMREAYWTGTHFRDALDNDLPSGDANVWPFHFGVFDDDEMERSAHRTLDERGMTEPVPLRYFEKRLPERELVFPKFATPNYQGDTSWTQLGAVYLGRLKRLDQPAFLHRRAAMMKMIIRDSNFMEVYTPDGQPYKGRGTLYYCDEGMIWASMFLDLL